MGDYRSLYALISCRFCYTAAAFFQRDFFIEIFHRDFS